MGSIIPETYTWFCLLVSFVVSLNWFNFKNQCWSSFKELPLGELYLCNAADFGTTMNLRKCWIPFSQLHHFHISISANVQFHIQVFHAITSHYMCWCNFHPIKMYCFFWAGIWGLVYIQYIHPFLRVDWPWNPGK